MMVRGVGCLLLVVVLCYSTDVVVSTKVPINLYWAQSESRLSFNISVKMSNGAYHESTSRVDLGSSITLTLPDTDCHLTSGGSRCSSCRNAQNCGCAPRSSQVMPAKCPDGSSPRKSPSVLIPEEETRVENYPEWVGSTQRSYNYCPAKNLAVELGNYRATLPSSDIGELHYLVGAGASCSWSNPGNTGFCGNSPFLKSMYSNVGTKIFSLAVSNTKIELGLTSSDVSKHIAKTKWSRHNNHSGRAVQVIKVNGKKVSPFYVTVDTGNSAFLSYCDPHSNGAECSSTSPLKQAQSLANGGSFNVTFYGGDTVSFHDDKMPDHLPFHVSSYNHDVFALGFLAHYEVAFDDGQQYMYFLQKTTVR